MDTLDKLFRERVTDLCILQVKVAGISKEAVRSACRILVTILPSREVSIRVLRSPGLLYNILVDIASDR